MNSQKIIFIVGPTAVGKSEVAVELAQSIDGEIVSCDSMQIYKEINIASAKPEQELLDTAPHHLIDIVSITDDFDVVRLNQLATQKIKEIHERNHVPIVVGGSGLYMQILLDGIFKGGKSNQRLRSDLRKLARDKGHEHLYEELKRVDPEAAKRIHVNDVRRVIRALEVNTIEEQPISDLQKKREGLWGHYDIQCFALNRLRKELYQRINQRVDQMFDEGMIDEVKRLYKENWSITAKGLIGIKEVFDYLDGQCDLDQTKSLVKQNTRRYAKRQLTWFRKERRLTWIDIHDETSKMLADKILEEINADV